MGSTVTKSDNSEIQEQVRANLEVQPRMLLGRRTSHEIESDPRHLLFVLSRYKFVAKMMTTAGHLFEVGMGDGFGATLVVQAGNSVTGIDLEPFNLGEMAESKWSRERIKAFQHDMVAGPFNSGKGQFDGAYSLDVIEHIKPEQEHLFLRNIVKSIKPTAPLIIGTPNVAAKAYASKQALAQHINWKSHETLLQSCKEHYENVFMFGMNDEVLHTGYAPMCHYLFALCTTPKQ